MWSRKVAAALLTAGLIWLLVVLLTRSVDRASAWASLFGPALDIAVALVALVRPWPANSDQMAQDKPPDDKTLDNAVADLATLVQKQWNQEAPLTPIRIRWSIADHQTANVEVQKAARTTVLDHGVVPEVGHVVELFRALPTRQIMVLGEGGAGKTVLAMLFTLGLLNSRAADEPVPVLLSASSWDPQEHLKAWMARRLLEDYPSLGTRHSSRAVEELVNKNRVMVVLDGLDEIPARVLPDAIAGLDRAVSGGHPVLVTCREDAYKSAVNDCGRILTRATVLKIQPMGLDDAANFLMAPERPSAKERWGRVMTELRSQPDAPLARVLTRPLMVSLAATAYAAPKSVPVKLLEFRDENAIENHLLEEFIPAVYHHAPPEPGTPTHRRYSPGQARAWLAFLACHLPNDLAWWKLVNVIPRRTRGISAGLVAGFLFGIAGVIGGAGVPGLSYRLEGGLVLSVVFGIATGVSYALSAPPDPLRIEIRFRKKLAPFLRLFVPGLVIGIVVGLGTGLPYQAAITAGPVFGVALAARVWVDEATDVTQGPSPRIVLTQDRTAAVFFGPAVALPGGILGGLVIWFPSGLAFGVIGGVVAMAAGTVVGAVAAGILGARAYGPVGRWSFAFAGAVVGGLVFEPTDTAAHAVLGVAYGVTFGLAIGFVALLSRASGSYAFSLFWLALRGDQPWRLMQFNSSTTPTAEECCDSPARPTSSATIVYVSTSLLQIHRPYLRAQQTRRDGNSRGRPGKWRASPQHQHQGIKGGLGLATAMAVNRHTPTARGGVSAASRNRVANLGARDTPAIRRNGRILGGDRGQHTTGLFRRGATAPALASSRPTR